MENVPSSCSTESLAAWLALVRAPGMGAVLGGTLVRAFGSPESALAAGPEGWAAAGIPAEFHAGLAQPDRSGIDADLAWLSQGNRSLVTIADPRYPELLKGIGSDAPLALFCAGDPALLVRTQVAIVGARSATPVGRETAHDFAVGLTRAGLLVTSGLALGIDGAAHRGALEAGGATIAVCGTSLESGYPSRHRELAAEIAAKGLLVSEFPTGTPPLAENFPRRNRIISGLSRAVLVIEAAEHSGSLITARLAIEQGREVFAVPGSIHSPLSRGSHRLIRNGAKLTECVADIVDEISPQLGLALGCARVSSGKLPERERLVLEALGFEATPFDSLIERVKLPVGELSEALLTLELAGRVACAPGGSYQRLGMK